MKVTIDIECTPQEARDFLGLPDVRPVQEAMTAALRERVSEMMSTVSAEELMKTWMPSGVPGGLAGMEAMQKMFWQAAGLGGEEQKEDRENRYLGKLSRNKGA